MKNLLLVLSFLIIAFHLAAQTQTWSEVKVHQGRQGIDRLARMGLAVEDGFYDKDGTWTTVLSGGELAKVMQAGFQTEVIHPDYPAYVSARDQSAGSQVSYINSHKKEFGSPDVSNYSVPENFHLGSMGGYLTLQEVLDELDSMRLHYPALVSARLVAGNTSTIGGRPIYYVRISNTPNQVTGKQKVLYNALTHAREPMGMQQLIFYMWYLLENYDSSDEIKYLVDHLELYFIPVVNPDGYEFNHENYPNGGGQWRKNRRDNGGGEFGVDLNRNFGYKWGYDDNGSSPYPTDETYRGATAFSEPETQVIRDFCIDNTFSLALSYHTYSNYTLYPWCWQTEPAPDSTLLTTYAGYLTRQNGYLTGEPGQILYNTNGDALDWQYGDTVMKPKVICFTSEIGTQSDGFWPFANRIIPLAQENMFSNLMMAHFALRFAEAHDRSPVILSTRQGYFNFDFMRFGMEGGANYTVTLHPVDSTQFVSTGGPRTFQDPLQLHPYSDSIAYLLAPSITSGDKISFVYEVNNGDYTYRDTITKYYGPPLVIFQDSLSAMENWSSAKWNVSTAQYHSAPGSLADSPSGNYGNYANASVTLNDGLNLQNSPVAVINFWTKWRTEQGYDYVQFNLSGDNGQWTAQRGLYTKTGFYLEAPGQPLYDGSQPSWVKEQVVTTAYSDRTLKMQFVLKSDGGLNFDGFYFDDVTVTVVDMTKVGTDQLAGTRWNLSDPIPNPAYSSVTIRYGAPVSRQSAPGFPGAELELSDARGMVVKHFPVLLDRNAVTFNVNDLAAGLYFYRISGTFGSTEVKKLVIIH